MDGYLHPSYESVDKSVALGGNVVIGHRRGEDFLPPFTQRGEYLFYLFQPRDRWIAPHPCVYLTLPYHVLSDLTLPYLALPYLTLLFFVHLITTFYNSIPKRRFLRRRFDCVLPSVAGPEQVKYDQI